MGTLLWRATGLRGFSRVRALPEMSKVDSQLLSDSIDKILAFSKGEEVDGEPGKKRNFLETVELQVGSRDGPAGRTSTSAGLRAARGVLL